MQEIAKELAYGDRSPEKREELDQEVREAERLELSRELGRISTEMHRGTFSRRDALRFAAGHRFLGPEGAAELAALREQPFLNRPALVRLMDLLEEARQKAVREAVRMGPNRLSPDQQQQLDRLLIWAQAETFTARVPGFRTQEPGLLRLLGDALALPAKPEEEGMSRGERTVRRLEDSGILPGPGPAKEETGNE